MNQALYAHMNNKRKMKKKKKKNLFKEGENKSKNGENNSTFRWFHGHFEIHISF
jgi:hypothetical protein